jgi:multiple sugar transport system substrate-binding protein
LTEHWSLLCCATLALMCASGCAPPDPGGTAGDDRTTITYWRHHAEAECAAMEALIDRFEADNPGIRVDLRTYPFGVYKTKVVATLTAGEGPDIVNIHNSWAYDYVDSGLIEPVPDELFEPGEIEDEFFDLTRAFSLRGVYYAVPTGGANLALFYNRAMFAEQGLQPPRTWSELEEAARALARRDRHGRLVRAGASIGRGDGQGWNLLVDGLLPQAGVELLADDGRAVAWNTPAGADVLAWFTAFAHGPDAPNSVLFPLPHDAFPLGISAMIIDGAWRIAALRTGAPDLDYGTALLPLADGSDTPATYGTAWGSAVTRRTSGDVRDAAWRFVRFLASYESMTTWAEHTGELPMRRRMLDDAAFHARMSEQTGRRIEPFIEQMPYARASLKKDETVYKKAIVDAVDRVLLRDVDPAEALADAADDVDAMLEEQ